MKKNILFFILGCLFIIVVQKGWHTYQYHRFKHEISIFRIVEEHVSSELEGVKILDIQMTPDPKTNVNYKYDKLWDAHITYEKDGRIKTVTAPYGRVDKIWITPSTSELVILDDKAKVIHEKNK